MTNNVSECCRNCKYWFCYSIEEEESYGWLAEGECHRYPPNVPVFDNEPDKNVPVEQLVLGLTKGTAFMSHPFTFADDWCGEFKCVDNPKWFED